MAPDTGRRAWNELDVDETLRVETTYRRRNGSTFPAKVHIRRVDVQGADRFLVSSRDISERKAYERRIERENERLDEFASSVSHDLRNPLSVLSGYLELARETGDDSYFDECENAIDDMNALIHDLLTLARQGRTVGECEPIGLAAVAADCWTPVEHEDARLVVDVADTVTVRADEGRLRQLLENLFRNSVEHGGSTVTVRIGTLADEYGFFVADDGPGIPADKRDVVFESGHSTTDDGTGFGLAIVERIANAHDWTVTLTESADGGARFEFADVEGIS